MSKKCIALYLFAFIFGIGIMACAHEVSSRRKISERFIAQIDLPSWLFTPFQVSPDGRREAYVAQLGNKQFVVVDGKEEKHYDGIGGGNLIFSPDSRRVAYQAVFRNIHKQSVVEDGKEEKQYDKILSPVFSPDSRRVAYVVQLLNKRFLVVDGKEGKEYDGIFTTGGGKIVFDTPFVFHYLIRKEESIYLVEEKIE